MTLSGSSHTGTAVTDYQRKTTRSTHLGPGENLNGNSLQKPLLVSPTSQHVNNLERHNTPLTSSALHCRNIRFSGHIQHSDGSNVEGALVNLSGSQVRTTTTDAAGNYTFTLLVQGDNFVVTPRCRSLTR
jgi:hypothetical protein